MYLLNDYSKMPYGKHKGKQLIDVPADYLLWLYYNNKASPSVKQYIEDNLEVLKKEAVENM